MILHIKYRSWLMTRGQWWIIYFCCLAICRTEVLPPCPDACKCDYSLECHNGGFNSIPANLSSSIQYIKMSHNNIPTILANSFLGLNEIYMIDLENNNIKNIEPSAFTNITDHLKIVNLSKNKISNLNLKMFEYLNHLFVLILDDNNIKVLEREVFNHLSSLNILKLSGNLLVTIEIGTFEKLTDLKDLSISRNKLQDIKKGLFNNVVLLESLDLSENRIEIIEPGTFEKLTNLESLNLYLNVIENVNQYTFLGLNSLTTLKIDSNVLKIIKRDTFIYLPNLLSLSLKFNAIEELESYAFHGLKNLHELSISSNRLSKLEKGVFEDLESLLVLDLSRNAIHAVGQEDFNIFRKLVTLDLSANRIICVHPDSFVSNLELNKLSLDHNRNLILPTDESLINSYSLRILELSNSNITNLPSKIFQNTPRLDTISLHGNQLEILDKTTFILLDDLVHLDLYNNVFICDCSLAKMYKWSHERKLIASVKCTNPPEYNGMSWNILNSSCKGITDLSQKYVKTPFSCKNYDYDHNIDSNKPDGMTRESATNSEVLPCDSEPSKPFMKNIIQPVPGICVSVLIILIFQCLLFIVITGAMVCIYYKRNCRGSFKLCPNYSHGDDVPLQESN